MTNKLRSVIEDARCRLIATQQDKETDYVHIVDVHNHVKETSLELLDAIIEEMEEDPMYLAKPDGEYEHVINQLKQARDELSILHFNRLDYESYKIRR